MPVLSTLNKNIKAFTIIEVIIAVFILTFGVVGVFGLIQIITTFTYDISSRLTAVYLAQEGIEIIRNIRDSNWLEKRYNQSLTWDDGISTLASYSLDYQSSVFPDSSCSGDYLKFDGSYYNCKPASGSNIQTNFKRQINLSKPEAGKMVAAVTVSWVTPHATQQVTAETELYDWR